MKYRIWDKVNKKYRADIYLKGNGELYELDFSCDMKVEKENYIIEQSTGIKDTNCVELYENDFVVDKRYNAKGVIKRNRDGLWLFGQDLDILGTYTRLGSLEKIGTIHEKENKNENY